MKALMDALMDGTMPKEAIREQSHALYARKKDLERSLAEAVEPPPLLHPEMASFYRDQRRARDRGPRCARRDPERRRQRDGDHRRFAEPKGGGNWPVSGAG